MGKRLDILEKRWDYAGKILVAVFGLILLWIACSGEMRYAEIDSSALPVISLQYRGSVFMEPGDIELARRDFPTLYKNIYSYEDLRSAKLLQITPTKWMSYYFPIYPFLCIPVKLLLTVLGCNQEHCFPVTNALLMLLALAFLQCKLKVSAKQRLIGCVLLMLSPALFYILYINYEVFMFSFLTLSLVQYCNAHYKSSALLLALAGMPNPTIMAIGIVMIVIFLYKEIQTARNEPWDFSHFIRYFKETVSYGIYYVPCLIPFVLQKLYLGSAVFSPGGGEDKYYFARVLSYLFDPTLGFPTFAPLQVVLFFVLVAVACLHKKPAALLWLAFLLSVVGAYSLMSHINCGMTFCARYVVWSYPVIAMFFATAGYDTLRPLFVKNLLYIAMAAVSGFLLSFNYESNNPWGFAYNPQTTWILIHFPQAYNPYSATFYCRTLHIGGCYGMQSVAYFEDPLNSEVRKLIYKATESEIAQIQNELLGDEASRNYLVQQLARNGEDGKFHYIDFPRGGKYKMRQKTPEERGELLEQDVVVEQYNFALEKNSTSDFPFKIQENSVYKVSLDLADTVDYDAVENLAVDFYANGYDNSAQEKNTFVWPGRDKYTFYFDSGDLPEETMDVVARVFIYGEGTNVPFDSLRVTKMEKLT